MSSPGFDCFYELDEDDRILAWGGPNWEAFARDNGAPALASRDLTGDRLCDHVAGHFTRRFLREFLAVARAADGPTTRRYRCDAADAKRLMEMRAQALRSGRLRVEHRLVETAPMARAVVIEPARGMRGASCFRCSMCNRLRLAHTKDWREPDEAAPDARVSVVHTVCSSCRVGVAARLPLRV